MALDPTWIPRINQRDGSFKSIALSRSRTLTDQDIETLVGHILTSGNRNINAFDLMEQLVTDESIKYLRRLPNLHSLILCENPQITDNCINELLQMPALRFIDLNLTDISEKGFIRLLQSKTLKEIHFESLPIQKETLDYIFQNNTLTDLRIDDSLLSEEEKDKLYNHLEDKNIPLISYPDTLFPNEKPSAEQSQLQQCELNLRLEWSQLIQKMSNEFGTETLEKVLGKFLQTPYKNLLHPAPPSPPTPQKT